jgi:hypothetical protein
LKGAIVVAVNVPLDTINKSFPATIQMDPTCCWAAGLSHWLKIMKDQGRPQISQNDFLANRNIQWEKDGSISMVTYTTLLQDERFKMFFRTGNSEIWPAFLNKMDADPVAAAAAVPLIVGYFDDGAQGNHVNVFCGRFPVGDNVKVLTMDPSPGYRTRPYHYYKAGKNTTMLLAWPREAGFM